MPPQYRSIKKKNSCNFSVVQVLQSEVLDHYNYKEYTRKY